MVLVDHKLLQINWRLLEFKQHPIKEIQVQAKDKKQDHNQILNLNPWDKEHNLQILHIILKIHIFKDNLKLKHGKNEALFILIFVCL